MLQKLLIIVLLAIFVCNAEETSPLEATRVSLTNESIHIDGKLDDNAWKNALWHELSHCDDMDKMPELTRIAIKRDRYESGRVKLLADNNYLYIGIEFTDRDVVAQGGENQTLLFSTGDVAEIFLNPENTSGYFELYVSPNGKQSSFYFPSGSYLGLPNCYRDVALPSMRVAVVVNGTLNNPGDEDKGWTAEMAIPLLELKAKTGIPFVPEEKWRMLSARYNYGIQMRSRQYSSFPALPQLNYHLLEYYSPIVINHASDNMQAEYYQSKQEQQ